MSKIVSVFLAGIILGALLAVGTFSLVLRNEKSHTGQNVRTLKLAHSLDPAHPVHKGMLHMKEVLERNSGGTMTLEIYPGSVLGGETETTEQLQNGVLDMMKSSSGSMESFVPEFQVFGLPYLFRDSNHLWKFADSDLGKTLLKKSVGRNMLGLCYYDAGSRSFYTKSRQIKTPDDLKGLKIRVMNSPMAITMVEMMGASPTPVSWGELYSALAQGTVDGAENNLPSFYTNKHYETCKYFSLDEHVTLPDMLMISTVVWNGLTDQQKAWLQDAADESSKFERELWATEDKMALEAVKKLGVEVYQPDKKPFMDKVAPMYAPYEGTPIGELVEQIRAIK